MKTYNSKWGYSGTGNGYITLKLNGANQPYVISATGQFHPYGDDYTLITGSSVSSYHIK